MVQHLHRWARGRDWVVIDFHRNTVTDPSREGFGLFGYKVVHSLMTKKRKLLPGPFLMEFSGCSHATYNICDSHRIGSNQKCYQHSTNVDQKSIETVFLIAICRPWGDKWRDKWQSKTLFLLIFDIRSSIVLFLIAICRQWGDKWQSQTLFLLIFDIRSSIVFF